MLRILVLLAGCLPLLAWPVTQYNVKVIEQKPQPRNTFVQGLQILDDYLYVSAGNYGESRLLRYHFVDGRLDVGKSLDKQFFAEGLTVLGKHIYQLTWRNGTMLVYRKSDLELQHWLPLKGEGWGLTNNGSELIYSDGSARLHFMSPEDAQILRSITVTQNGRPVTLLNELEWVEGAIWANIWHSDRIVVIDPRTGDVTASINLQDLLPAAEYRPDTDVLNGIARNPADGGIWVTGKRWPWLYRIELQPADEPPQIEESESNSR